MEENVNLFSNVAKQEDALWFWLFSSFPAGRNKVLFSQGSLRVWTKCLQQLKNMVGNQESRGLSNKTAIQCGPPWAAKQELRTWRAGRAACKSPEGFQRLRSLKCDSAMATHYSFLSDSKEGGYIYIHILVEERRDWFLKQNTNSSIFI